MLAMGNITYFFKHSSIDQKVAIGNTRYGSRLTWQVVPILYMAYRKRLLLYEVS